jgi:hypothetical protein
MITRHQFLTMLHDLLRPHVYLEIGVQFGLSLDLAVYSEWAIGVDPVPQREQRPPRESIYRMTSAKYFEFPEGNAPDQVDLAFIDGSHLYEDALSDFINIAKLCGPKSVVVFDDVLPYSVEMTSREPIPGDWTGDVWKVAYTLWSYLADPVNQGALGVRAMTVNTFPTGALAVWGFEHMDISPIEAAYPDLAKYRPPPDHVLTSSVIPRIGAQEAEFVIDRIREDLGEQPS